MHPELFALLASVIGFGVAVALIVKVFQALGAITQACEHFIKHYPKGHA